MKRKKRWLALTIVIVMMITSLSPGAVWAVTADDIPIEAVAEISGEPEETNVKNEELVNETESSGLEIIADGTSEVIINSNREETAELELSAEPQSIARDYDQTITVQVKNPTANPVNYYLTCVNPYDDLYMNFVKNGSQDRPQVILAGETQTVELSVFSQNARNTEYAVPITAVVNGKKDVEQYMLRFNCDAPDGLISIKKGEVNKATQAVTYTITNIGTKLIADLSLNLTGDAQTYAWLNPGVENLSLEAGKSITVEVVPDLYQMKQEHINQLEGTIEATGGIAETEQNEANVEIHVDAAAINTISSDRLALYQEGNPYYDAVCDEDSVEIFVRSSGKEKNLRDIVARYYDPDNPVKDGVNTEAEYDEVMKELINPQTGLFDFEYRFELYCAHDDSRYPVVMSVKTSPAESDTPSEGSIVPDGNGFKVTTEAVIDSEDYEQFLSGLDGIKENLGLTEQLETRVSMSSYATQEHPVNLELEVAVDNMFGEAGNTMEDIAAATADSAKNVSKAAKVCSGAMKAFNYAETVNDIIDLNDVMNHPEISNSMKAQYASLQILNTCNNYILDPLMSRGGAVMGASAFDGPGAVMGYTAGKAVSMGIDYFTRKMLNDIKDQMNGGGSGVPYGSGRNYKFAGSQCTNAHQTTARFHMEDIEDVDDAGMIVSARVYDGTPYGGVIDYIDKKLGGDTYRHNHTVTSVYKINEKTAGSSKNGGLTRLDMVDLSKSTGSLKSGKSNTLKRVYSTNAGHYQVTSDTEINLLLPSDAKVGYVGNIEDMEEDVRLLPDFAVYMENIADSESETNGEHALDVYFYNRGSQSGWVNITVSDMTSQRVLYQEENRYMEAFTEQMITVPWEPASRETTICVKLENAIPDDMDERDITNNEATAVITVDEDAEIPVIKNISPEQQEIASQIYLTADIQKPRFLSNVIFTVDGVEYAWEEGAVTLSLNDDGSVRASAAVGGLEAGLHDVQVRIVAQIFNEIIEECSTDKQISILPKEQENVLRFIMVGGKTAAKTQYVTQSISRTINSWYYRDIYERPASFSWVNDDVCELTLDSSTDMEHFSEYSMVLTCKGVVYRIPLQYLDGCVLSSEGEILQGYSGKSYKRSFHFGTGGEKITNLRFTSIGLMDMHYDSSVGQSKEGALYTDDDNNLLLIGSFSTVNYVFSCGFTVDGIGNDECRVARSISQSGGNVKLSNSWRMYTLDTDFPDDVQEEELFIRLKPSGTSTNYEVPGIHYDTSNGTLKILAYGKNYYDGGVAYIGCRNALYMFSLSADEVSGVLTKSDLGRLDFTAEEDFTITDVTASVNGLDVHIPGTSIYLPEGSYTLVIDYILGGIQQSIQTTAFVQADEAQTLMLSKEEKVSSAEEFSFAAEISNVLFNWKTVFSGGLLRYTEESGTEQICAVRKGSSVSLPNGLLSYRLCLEGPAGISAEFSGEVNVSRENTSVEPGNVFSGQVMVPEKEFIAGEICTLSFKELLDENGIRLSDFEAALDENALCGEVMFTNISDSSSTYTVPVQTKDLSDGISMILPDYMMDGNYHCQVRLCTEPSQFDEATARHITVQESDGGRVSLSADSAQPGETFTIVISPDADYELKQLNVTDVRGGKCTVTRVDEMVYSVIMPGNDIIVSADFHYLGKVMLKIEGTKKYDKIFGDASFVLDARLIEGEGKLTYESSDSQVVTVSENGMVTIQGAGTAEIKVAVSEAEQTSEEFVVTVTVAKTEQKIEGTNVYAKKTGDSAFYLDARLTEGNGELSYVSSNPTVATVSNTGLLTITGKGNTEITVTAAETKNYKSCKFKVSLSVSDRSAGITVPSVGKLLKNSNASYRVVVKGTSVEYYRPLNKNAVRITIPSTVTLSGRTYKVTGIAKKAFGNCKKLKTVSIGKNVSSIGQKAFYKCKKLRRIIIPANVRSIGKKAFFGCSALKSIVIKTKRLTQKSVGAKAFKGIYAKAKIKAPKNKKKAYKKLLKKKGSGNKVKIS